MDAVVKQVLPPAGQHFFAFIGAEAEIIGNPLGGIGHALFATGGEAQGPAASMSDNREWAWGQAAFLRPRLDFGAAVRSARMRSSKALAGSSAGSCGTSSPLKAFANTD